MNSKIKHKQYTDSEVREQVLNLVKHSDSSWTTTDAFRSSLVHKGIAKYRIHSVLSQLAAEKQLIRVFDCQLGWKYTVNSAYVAQKFGQNYTIAKPVNKWGPWRFASNLTLVNDENYEIDLEQVNSSAKMLDWIFQVSKKGRDQYCVNSLVLAFNDIFKPQKNCCSFGVDKDFSGSELAKIYWGRINPNQHNKRRCIKPSLRFKILHRDNSTCQVCGVTAADGAKLQIDHILPVSKGGTNEESNLRVLCSECNIGRGDRYDT